ncbi:MAG: putative ubiquitin carboxyl-terminal hydrolase creB [Chlamydiales bacterium]|jgi:hypothetical protein|nr:putative ubiquitin carboxyl-terminal hydrolase creB [Chlamydiales bacterium]
MFDKSITIENRPLEIEAAQPEKGCSDGQIVHHVKYWLGRAVHYILDACEFFKTLAKSIKEGFYQGYRESGFKESFDSTCALIGFGDEAQEDFLVSPSLTYKTARIPYNPEAPLIPAPKGIRNPRTTCFINASIQAIRILPYYREALQDKNGWQLLAEALQNDNLENLEESPPLLELPQSRKGKEKEIVPMGPEAREPQADSGPSQPALIEAEQAPSSPLSRLSPKPFQYDAIALLEAIAGDGPISGKRRQEMIDLIERYREEHPSPYLALLPKGKQSLEELFDADDIDSADEQHLCMLQKIALQQSSFLLNQAKKTFLSRLRQAREFKIHKVEHGISDLKDDLTGAVVPEKEPANRALKQATRLYLVAILEELKVRELTPSYSTPLEREYSTLFRSIFKANYIIESPKFLERLFRSKGEGQNDVQEFLQALFNLIDMPHIQYLDKKKRPVLQHFISVPLKHQKLEDNLTRLSFERGLEPAILPLQLMRFKKVGVGRDTVTFKDNCKILLPDTLEINLEGEPEKITYQLRSVVLHSGSLGTGHYLAGIKEEDSWTLYDDALVTKGLPEEGLPKASIPIEMDSDAYIVYYEKRN